MSSEWAIRAVGLSKVYPVYSKPHHRLLQMVSRTPGKWHREFTALDGVDLQIARGETVGIVGRNGSGKSTLLQLICGTLTPSAGEVEVNGRIAALLELGAGFNPEFSGRENVRLYGSILGLSPEEVDERLPDILAFADIGDFVDQPVKTYSSGMYVRLAFAVAIHVEPDILVVDEALSVGDEGFQRKCFARLDAIRARGATILFVSHAAGTVVDLCDRAVLLDRGEVIAQGTPKHVVSQYQRMLHAPPGRLDAIRAQIRAMAHPPPIPVDDASPERRPVPPAREAYWEEGLVPPATVQYENRGAEIEDPHIQTIDGRKVNVLAAGDEYLYVYRLHMLSGCASVRCGMMVRTVTGIDLGGCVSGRTAESMRWVDAGSRLEVRIRFRCLMAPGTYFLNAGVVALFEGGEEFVNRWVDVAMFRVMPGRDSAATGLVDFDVVPQVRLLEAET